jgi:hypothetical protein
VAAHSRISFGFLTPEDAICRFSPKNSVIHYNFWLRNYPEERCSRDCSSLTNNYIRYLSLGGGARSGAVG